MNNNAAVRILPSIDIEGKNTSGSALKAVDKLVRDGAFSTGEEEKIELISQRFEEIMQLLGLDLSDDSLKGTPKRVAKMYVKEIFGGLNSGNAPSISLFENGYGYSEMLLEKNITVQSTCEHHFLPIIGKAHVAYYANGKVIGLSKINRMVEYYSRRPQVQERLTVQIAEALKEAIGAEDVAVIISADHHCVRLRGVEDACSATVTAHYSGKFRDENVKKEFLSLIRLED
jgi:GTP cyclohydrolase I